MGTFDTLLLAFDMDERVDEAQSFWNMILHTHERSISRRLFSRMISIYTHHNMPHNVIEVRTFKIIFPASFEKIFRGGIFSPFTFEDSIWVVLLNRSNKKNHLYTFFLNDLFHHKPVLTCYPTPHHPNFLSTLLTVSGSNL